MICLVEVQVELGVLYFFVQSGNLTATQVQSSLLTVPVKCFQAEQDTPFAATVIPLSPISPSIPSSFVRVWAWLPSCWAPEGVFLCSGTFHLSKCG